jgi:hypothetical protein
LIVQLCLGCTCCNRLLGDCFHEKVMEVKSAA